MKQKAIKIGQVNSNSNRNRYFSAYILLVFLIFFPILIFEISSSSLTLKDMFTNLTVLIWINIILSGFMLHRNIVNSKSILFINYWIFNYIFFGITTLIQVIDPNIFYIFSLSSENTIIKSQVLILSVNAMLIFVEKTFHFDKNENSNICFNEIDMTSRRMKSYIFLYFVCTPLLITMSGGIRFLISPSRIVASSYFQTKPLGYIAQSMLFAIPLVLLLICIYQFLYKKKTKFVLTTCLLAFWVIFLSNPISQPRQVTLYCLMPPIAMLLHYYKKYFYIYSYFLILTIIFAANLINRSVGHASSQNIKFLSQIGDFDAFSQLRNGIQMADAGAFKPFSQILGSLLFFVPRSFWPEKPYDTGVTIAKYFGLKYTNLSAPLILEFYVNAGWVGVFVGFYLLARHIKKLEFQLKDARSVLLLSAYSGLALIILRGSLLQATGKIVVTLVSILFLTRSINHRNNRDMIG